MYGPKTEIVLQKPTRTDADGGYSYTWSNVETISSARIRPFSAEEKRLFGRDAVITMKKCHIAHNDIAEANRQYLVAKGRILIDSLDYDIQSVEPFTGPGRHYKVILRKVT